ncbi:hypothetical protein F444_13638 [Phytophthora nicotianae P1976]|uniref:Chromo domain-containing protein n=1 Tax=Phytophthora nicotianae P1976 TaxID=1317066 RepID=A0A080ZT80_PHYNI|nr:hypothetical protein F444_13638 [Phytophthora nicotianae P1976]
MGKSPVEVFTGLSREPILNVITQPRAGAAVHEVVQRDTLNCEEQLAKLRTSLAELHADIADRKEKRRLQQKAAKKGAVCTFSVGDFVLWSRADPRMAAGKLMVRWVGPFRVAEELPTSFLIEHLLTGEKFDVHAIRLKHYADNMLEVTEELKHHIGLQGIKLGVRAITDTRYNRQAKEWQLLVGWQGLEAAEDSWEPLDSIYEAVPEKVAEFVSGTTNSRLKTYFNNQHNDNEE